MFGNGLLGVQSEFSQERRSSRPAAYKTLYFSQFVNDIGTTVDRRLVGAINERGCPSAV